MSLEASFNFRRISDTVTTSGVVDDEHLGGLRADGYDVLINLLPDSSEYAVKGEAAIVARQGVEYVHIPVDFAAPTSADFDAFVRVMDAHDGKTVHIHCAANYRVSAFYSLYAIRRGVWNTADADAHIRSIWNPADHPAWDAFIAAERLRLKP